MLNEIGSGAAPDGSMVLFLCSKRPGSAVNKFTSLFGNDNIHPLIWQQQFTSIMWTCKVYKMRVLADHILHILDETIQRQCGLAAVCLHNKSPGWFVGFTLVMGLKNLSIHFSFRGSILKKARKSYCLQLHFFKNHPFMH